MMKSLSKVINVLITSFILVSCQTSSQIEGDASPAWLANFQKVLVKGGDFQITTYQKIKDKSAPYIFYIEGDGAAFAGKYKVSTNPTPRQKMFLRLATLDQRPNIVYIARPCQYTPMELNPKCNNSYWTSKRLSDDSVDAINDVINKINHNQKFSLVGYSGGGGIAVLIAARNPKVKDIITIGGNLDHQAFTEHHKVTSMVGSLNPIDYARTINNIPQLHLSGGKDHIVPPFIAQKYVQASASNCVKQKVFSNIDHKTGWDKVWEDISFTPITCSN